MSQPSGSTKRRKESTSESDGKTTSEPVGEPSIETLTTLHSSDWQNLFKEKQPRTEILDLFHSNRDQFDRESFQFEDEDGLNLGRMCALYRFQCLYLTESVKHMDKKNNENKAKMKELIERNHLFSMQHKLRKLTEEIWQNLFTTKVMYAIFRRTPFAAHMVCSFCQCSAPVIVFVSNFSVHLSTMLVYIPVPLCCHSL